MKTDKKMLQIDPFEIQTVRQARHCPVIGIFYQRDIWQPPELPTKVTQGGGQMSRHDLTDDSWNAIRHLFPRQNERRRGRPWNDHRTVVNGIIWILQTGSPWRDLPSEFGK
jgi:hypothetical protein